VENEPTRTIASGPAKEGSTGMKIDDILRESVRQDASDIIISAGAPVTYHVHGALVQYEPGNILSPEMSRDLVYSLLDEKQRRQFEEDLELDMSYEMEHVARFRLAVYHQRGTIAAVLRVIPIQIPHYTDVGLSTNLMSRLAHIPNGLVLVTGPTGAGKSTTIASWLQYLNTEGERAKHIITIEDPVEYDFDSEVCVIDQRELGTDTKSYVAGLRSALRQMPHIIFVGEMRDRETMEVAPTAAETGNLVISTLSTQSSAKTINRIIDVFPLNDQAEIRTRLALSLRCVISQVLLGRQDEPGRVAARELLFVTNSVANLIREGKIHQINNVISSSAKDGMVLLDDSMIELQRLGFVARADILPRFQDADKARTLLEV